MLRKPQGSRIPTLPPVLRAPGLPHPSVHSSPSVPRVGGSHSGGRSTVGPWGVGEGRAQRTKSLGWGGAHAHPEETVAQCPGLPQAHSGLLFPDSPSGGNPNSISALLTPSVGEEASGQRGPDHSGSHII